MPVYATRDDLVDSPYVTATISVPDDPEATRLLTRASGKVDELLLTAIYDTDSGGAPTDAKVIEALKEATCAQAAWWLETGDESGVQGRYQSVGIGSVSLTRAGAGSARGVAGDDTASPDAARVLRLAGLLQQEPLIL
jgi:hypothetical protein